MAAWGQRASTAKMKECIGEVLTEMLKDHTYKQDEAPELTRAVLALQAERHKLGEMGVIEAITRGEPIGSSLMRIFDTSIPGDDEYDGRNALGCRDLFCEEYFEANPSENVIYATYYGTPDI